MPLTLRARTLLKWNSHLGSTYRASSRRRKALGWHLWGYAYFLACLIFFDRMVLSSCSLSCSKRVIISPKKEGVKDKCNLNGPHSTIDDLCSCLNQLKSHEEQKPLLERLHLDFCCTLPFHEHLAFLANATECSRKLSRIVNDDCLASQGYSKFQEIIQRIDCNVEYSVRWKCEDCKVAYKEWMCSNLVLPAMIESNYKNTCTHASCKKVLQRCPYFLPFPDYQWSGQSAFECETEKKDTPQCVAVPETKCTSGKSNTRNSDSVS